MTQTIIRQKLKRYVTILEREHLDRIALEIEQADKKHETANLKRLHHLRHQYKAHFDQLKEALSEGICFGLGVCHAAFDYIGLLSWWESILTALIEWDETPAALNDSLNHSILTKHSNTQLRHILDFALNYILMNQGSLDVEPICIKDLTQYNLLAPKINEAKKTETHPFFSVIDNHGKIHMIQHREKIAGSIPKKLLLDIFHEAEFNKTICLIHSLIHTIRIDFKNNTWMIYNPRHPHKLSQTLLPFEHKDQFVDSIITMLSTHSICIENASLNEHNQLYFKAYYEYAKENPELLLHDLGLHILAKETPAFLQQLFSMHINNHDHLFLTTLALALVRPKEDGGTGLYMIAKHAPYALPSLLALIDANQDDRFLIQSLIKSLTTVNQHGVSGLQLIIENAPDVLPLLHFYTRENTNVQTYIANAIRKNQPLSLSRLFISSQPPQPVSSHTNDHSISPLTKMR